MLLKSGVALRPPPLSLSPSSRVRLIAGPPTLRSTAERACSFLVRFAVGLGSLKQQRGEERPKVHPSPSSDGKNAAEPSLPWHYHHDILCLSSGLMRWGTGAEARRSLPYQETASSGTYGARGEGNERAFIIFGCPTRIMITT